MVVIRTEMFMMKTYSKRNGSNSYRNVHDENPFKKKWWSFVQKCALRKPIQKEMVVIRTEIFMKKTYSKRNGSHSYRNVHDENPFKKKWYSFV